MFYKIEEMDEKDGPFLSKVEGVVNVSIERLGA